MIDVVIPWLLIRKGEAGGVLQASGIARGPFSPQRVPLVDMFQLGAQNSGMDIVETAVIARAVA